MRHNLGKHRSKNLCAVLLCAALVFFSGCSGTTPALSSQGEAEANTAPKGRYVEEELSPQAPESDPLVVFKNENFLFMLTPKGFWGSSDGGESWNPVKEEASGKKVNWSFGLIAAAMGPKEEMLFAYNAYHDQTMAVEYQLLTPEGKLQTLELQLPAYDPRTYKEENSENEFFVGKAENALYFFRFLPDGSLIGLDRSGEIHHIDLATGKIIKTLHSESEAGYVGFTLTKSTLIAQTCEGIDLYDLTDWKVREKDEVLFQFLYPAQTSDPANMSVSGGGAGLVLGGNTLFQDSEEDAVYICNKEGLFRHVLGGGTVEQVISGTLNSLSDPSRTMLSMVPVGEKVFLGVYLRAGEEHCRLVRYTYDPQMAAMPEKELKAYAFSDTPELRQAVAHYQKTHPETYVNVEIGQTNDGTMTDDAVIEALNARIEAGKAPDVFFLDNLPVQDYFEKGLLLDLKELVAGLEDQYFKHILTAYEKDGALCAVPTRFTIPVQIVPKALETKMNSLSETADVVEQLRKENPEQKSITGLNDPESLIKAFYNTGSAALLGTDGATDKEKLCDFLNQLGRIYQTELPSEANSDLKKTDEIAYSILINQNAVKGLSILKGDSLVDFEEICSTTDVSVLWAGLKKLENKLAYYSLNPQAGQNIFVPKGVVGVSAKSTMQEEAKSFVKYLLSSEGQQIDHGLGLPVNEAAFETLSVKDFFHGDILYKDKTDKQLVLEVKWPEISVFHQLKKTIALLDTPATENRQVFNTILTEGERALKGEVTAEAAANSISTKIHLFSR